MVVILSSSGSCSAVSLSKEFVCSNWVNLDISTFIISRAFNKGESVGTALMKVVKYEKLLKVVPILLEKLIDYISLNDLYETCKQYCHKNYDTLCAITDTMCKKLFLCPVDNKYYEDRSSAYDVDKNAWLQAFMRDMIYMTSEQVKCTESTRLDHCQYISNIRDIMNAPSILADYMNDLFVFNMIDCLLYLEFSACQTCQTIPRDLIETTVISIIMSSNCLQMFILRSIIHASFRNYAIMMPSFRAIMEYMKQYSPLSCINLQRILSILLLIPGEFPAAPEYAVLLFLSFSGMLMRSFSGMNTMSLSGEMNTYYLDVIIAVAIVHLANFSKVSMVEALCSNKMLIPNERVEAMTMNMCFFIKNCIQHDQVPAAVIMTLKTMLLRMKNKEAKEKAIIYCMDCLLHESDKRRLIHELQLKPRIGLDTANPYMNKGY